MGNTRHSKLNENNTSAFDEILKNSKGIFWYNKHKYYRGKFNTLIFKIEKLIPILIFNITTMIPKIHGQ